jgi:hypothetical protein
MIDRALASLEAWRASGDDRVNRVRFRMIEAYALRASKYEGDARRVMDARLSELIEAYERDVANKKVQDNASAESPLAQLLQEMNQRAATHAAPAELADYLRAVWSRVSAEKRLRESLAQVPKNAGPLNSSSLVHRSLSLMREVSPEYLQHFLSYLDSLAWLEDTSARPAPTGAPSRNKRGG